MIGFYFQGKVNRVAITSDDVTFALALNRVALENVLLSRISTLVAFVDAAVSGIQTNR